MEHPLLKKLTGFARFHRVAIPLFFSEVVLLTIAISFCLSEWADYVIWRYFFVDFSIVTQIVDVGLLIFVLSFGIITFRSFIRVPATPRDCVRFLRKISTSHVPLSPNSTQLPQLPDSLESAIDFLEKSDSKHFPSHMSRELCDTVIQNVWEEFQGISLEAFTPKAFRKRTLKVFGGLTVFVLFSISVFFSFYPDFCVTALSRFFTPWNETFWPLQTKIQWNDFDDEILLGNDFQAEILVDTDISRLEASYWEIASPASNGTRFFLRPIDGKFYIRVEKPKESFRISVTIPGQPNFAENNRTITVCTRPSLKDTRIQIFPPPSTQQPKYDASWDLSGLYGTRIGMLLTADRPLTRARLYFEDGTFIPGTILAESPSRCLFAMELTHDLLYRVELMDSKGLTSELETHRVTLETDQPPESVCLEPANGRILLPAARVKIRLSGKDDYGLRGLGFRWIVQNSESVEISEKNTSSPKLKWTNFNLWTCPPNEDFPTRRNVDFLWNLAELNLQPGAQIRLEPASLDTANSQTYGPPTVLRIVTPEEMTSYANLRWRAIYQELQNLDTFLFDAQHLLSSRLKEENSSKETITFLQNMLAVLSRAGDEKDSLSLRYAVRIFEMDLHDNPEFFFQNGATSKEQEAIVVNLSGILDTLFNVQYPALRKIIHELPADFQRQNSFVSLTLAIEEIRAEIHPFLVQFTQEEDFAQSKRTFHEIFQNQSKLSADIIQYISHNDSRTISIPQNSANSWSSFSNRQWDIFDKLVRFEATNPFDSKNSNQKDTFFQLVNQTRSAILELQRCRPAEALRTQALILKAFAEYERNYSPVSETNLQTMAAFFERMQSFQTEILETMEAFSTEAEEPPTTKIKFSRKNRIAFLSFAESQRTFAKKLDNAEIPIPSPLKVSISSLTDDFSLSASSFELIASRQQSTREIMDDQLSLQLQLFDKIVAIHEICANISENKEDFISIFELENKANSSEPEHLESIFSKQLTVENILILRSMQELVRKHTSELSAPDLSQENLAEQISFLREDQQKIIQAAKISGVNSEDNPTLQNIFTQMNQVDFLFSQQDVGKMNLEVQHEIIYNLSGLLRKNDKENSATQTVQQESSENMSENADSHSLETSEFSSPSDFNEESETSTSSIPEIQKAFWVELPKDRQRELNAIPNSRWIPGYEKMIDLYYHHLRQ